MVWIPIPSSLFWAERPTKNSSRMGSGHIFSGISSGKRVWHMSGFLKSEAILARSLLGAIPIFTVKPSSRQMRSRI